MGLEVKADLVALGACASGVSAHQGGDELIGLTRSFLYAGATSLIVSLWYVADKSTRLIMECFYSILLEDGYGEKSKIGAKAEALRRAQQHVMRIDGFEHPYFWAPLVLIGDWQ